MRCRLGVNDPGITTERPDNRPAQLHGTCYHNGIPVIEESAERTHDLTTSALVEILTKAADFFGQSRENLRQRYAWNLTPEHSRAVTLTMLDVMATSPATPRGAPSTR